MISVIHALEASFGVIWARKRLKIGSGLHFAEFPERGAVRAEYIVTQGCLKILDVRYLDPNERLSTLDPCFRRKDNREPMESSLDF